MVKYLRVRNWETFQQYRDRRPTWIKVYVELLDNYEFAKLPDALKGQLVGIWLLAAQTGNRIPFDADWVAKRISATEPVNLQVLISFGFLEYEPSDESVQTSVQNCTDDSGVTERGQSKFRGLETERETEGEERRGRVVVGDSQATPGSVEKSDSIASKASDWIRNNGLVLGKNGPVHPDYLAPSPRIGEV